MNSQEDLQIFLRLGIGALSGLAVGIEREWSGRSEAEPPRFAGVRTFLLIGLLSTFSAVLIEKHLIEAGIAILTGSVLLVLIAYAAGAYRGNRESTTEFAALIVITAGTLAGTGRLAIACALTVFVALILAEKSRIHSFVYRIRSEDLIAGLRFAVLALVVLPLLPIGPLGPEPGISPRELWGMVLLFSGLSFAAFIARRSLGATHGYTVAGMIAGLISSTLATLNFSRESRTDPSAGKALALGVIAACTVLPARVAFFILVLDRAIGLAVLPHLACVFIVGLVLLVFLPKKTSTEPEKSIPSRNPLRLGAAIQMVLAFQLALIVFHFVSQRFGQPGILITAGIAGLTDVDTLTFMVGKQAKLDTGIAAQALIIGIIANTVLKMALTLVIGKGTFRVVASVGLLVLIAALILSLVVF